MRTVPFERSIAEEPMTNIKLKIIWRILLSNKNGTDEQCGIPNFSLWVRILVNVNLIPKHFFAENLMNSSINISTNKTKKDYESNKN